MKKYICILLLMFCAAGVFAQPYNKQTVGGLVRTDTSQFRTKVLFDSVAYFSWLAGGDTTDKALNVDANGKVYVKTIALSTAGLIPYTDTTPSGVIVTSYALDTAKTNLRNSAATKIPYTDTGGTYFPTKYFLLNNYLKNGGNTWGATWSVGAIDNRAGQVVVNSISRMDFFTSGNVGIATAGVNDGSILHVNGNTNITGLLTANNTSNSNLCRLVSNVTDPYLQLFRSGAFDGRIATKAALTAIAGAGMVFTDGTNNVGVEAARWVVTTGIATIYNPTGNSKLTLFGSGDNGIGFSEMGVVDRGWLGYADGSSAMTFRVNGAISPSTGTLAMSLSSTGNMVINATEYANNAAAITGGLAVGTLYYRTGHGLDIVR